MPPQDRGRPVGSACVVHLDRMTNNINAPREDSALPSVLREPAKETACPERRAGFWCRTKKTEPCMQVTIDLTDPQAEKLKQSAMRLGVDPVELARAAVSDLLSTPDEDFRAVAHHVLRKYSELYRRLARCST